LPPVFTGLLAEKSAWRTVSTAAFHRGSPSGGKCPRRIGSNLVASRVSICWRAVPEVLQPDAAGADGAEILRPRPLRQTTPVANLKKRGSDQLFR
jgi:hypothetical protein